MAQWGSSGFVKAAELSESEGEQVCFSVHFGVIIEMDGSDCCPARSAEPTVDHWPAQDQFTYLCCSPSVCLETVWVDAFTYSILS